MSSAPSSKANLTLPELLAKSKELKERAYRMMQDAEKLNALIEGVTTEIDEVTTEIERARRSKRKT